MRNNYGKALMAAGVLFLTGALALTLCNAVRGIQAGEKSDKTVSILQEEIPYYTQQSDSQNVEDGVENSAAPEQTIEINGQAYIGVLDIPALELSLPVLDQWSNSLMNLSPCRYDGSFLNDTMIIAGHNYQKHFGRLSRLQYGDSVTFTDVAGKAYEYVVVDMETMKGTAVEQMKSGDWDLTLFTCTLSGSSRVTVRCDRVK